MRKKIFEYTKDGVKTLREVFVLNESEESVEGIDLTKLDADERVQMQLLSEKLEKDMEPFVRKGYRRFLKKLMS
jgi:hypothetical protein